MKKMEKGYKTFLVKDITRLKEDLKALRNMTEEEEPPRLQIRETIQAVAYLMVDSSRLGFVSVMWFQRRLV